MNRRLLLKPMYPHAVSLGASGYVGYDGLDLAAKQMWERAVDWLDGPTPPVNSGDRITIKRMLPFNPIAAIADERNRGLSMAEIVDRATTHLAREEEKNRSKLLYDMLRAGSLNINPFFKVPPVQHNKLLLKRKKS